MGERFRSESVERERMRACYLMPLSALALAARAKTTMPPRRQYLMRVAYCALILASALINVCQVIHQHGLQTLTPALLNDATTATTATTVTTANRTEP